MTKAAAPKSEHQPARSPQAPAEGRWPRLQRVGQTVVNYVLGPPAAPRRSEPAPRSEAAPVPRRPTNGSRSSPFSASTTGAVRARVTGMGQARRPVTLWSKLARGAGDDVVQPDRSGEWLARGEWLMDAFSDVTVSRPGGDGAEKGQVTVTNHRLVFTRNGGGLLEWPVEAASHDSGGSQPARVRVGEDAALDFPEEQQATDFVAAARAAAHLRRYQSLS